MALKKYTISLEESRQFSSLFMDYVNGKPGLRKFYTYEPSLSSFEQAIADRKKSPLNRAILAEVLLDQYRNKMKAPVIDLQHAESLIGRLNDENTFTVCTGHQPCIFTGPLYFIYKIITTINLAGRLKKEYPGYHFVPVYWIGSEDHDFEEISSVNVFGKKMSWTTDQRGAVGRMDTSGMKTLLDELQQILGNSDNAKQLHDLFVKAYLEHSTLSDATRYLVHELFASRGLLIIDADDTRLKSLFMPVMKDDLLNNTNHKLVSASIAGLIKAGYEAQVNPREINLFQLSSKDRVRIEKADETVLKLKPEELSTNVVLRPLYQQMILPNLAYVGGPGEIAYWLEYKAMFDHHQIQFPVLIPRNFVLLTDEKATQQLERLGFEYKDLFRDIDSLIKAFISRHAESDISLKKQETEMRAMFTTLAEKAAALDPTLKASVEGELQKALASLKNIENKLLRSEKQKQETNINQLRKLKDKLLPDGVLQERHDNFVPYYLKKGKDLVPSLMAACEPFDRDLKIIEL